MSNKFPNQKMSVQLNTRIDPSLAHRLRVKLKKDESTIQDWLEARIREYAPPIRRARKGQEARQ